MIAECSFQHFFMALDEVKGRSSETIELHGFEVGHRLVEKVIATRTLAADHLEAIKFLCKDFWSIIFGKQIDKLQTNHRGVFVLKDYACRWLSRYSCIDDAIASAKVLRLLQFPCGLLRGALANLGLRAIVTTEVPSCRPACSFSIQIL